ncbi:hypothetical protein J4434_03080 [Candidatus Woesearchaeota archaeon]|nr:hypothetical protein [Candidatus Woesearchaeota archaeon]
MAKKVVKMNLSSNGYKNFKKAMKKMKFKSKELFLKYCTLNTIKTIATSSQKKQIAKEMNLIKKAKPKR